MIDPCHDLPVVRQAQLLEISHSTVYYLPRPVSAADLVLMRRIDELHLNFPFAGARMLRDMLKLEGFAVGRKHVQDGHQRPLPQAQYQRSAPSA
jgi:putative transposase